MGEESGHSTEVMAEGVGYPARVACGSSEDEGVGPKIRLVAWFVSREPSKSKEATWPTPKQLWYRVHIDYAGSVHGKSLLIVVGAMSRWPEVFLIHSATSQATIELLQSVFSDLDCLSSWSRMMAPSLHQKNSPSSFMLTALLIGWVPPITPKRTASRSGWCNS